MAFNLVDQQGRHRGVVLSRFIRKSTFVKTNQGFVWLAYITPFGVEDLGIRLRHIRGDLCKAWRIPQRNGQFDRGKLQTRLEALCRTQHLTDLDEEARIRMASVFRRMFPVDGKMLTRLQTGVAVLVNPREAHIQGNEISIALPELPVAEPVTDSAPVFFRIQGKPRCVTTIRMHEMAKLHEYSVEFKARSGNVVCDALIPYPLINLRDGDEMLLQLSDDGKDDLITLAGLEIEFREHSNWFF